MPSATHLLRIAIISSMVKGTGDGGSLKGLSVDFFHLLFTMDTVITPFLPPGFSRVSARKTRQPEPSRPVPTRAHHLEYSQKEGPRHISQGLTKFD
jgi:hypothetical protein